ncbi:MAG: VOC family protein, partial [Acidimicrobiia bacterium]
MSDGPMSSAGIPLPKLPDGSGEPITFVGVGTSLRLDFPTITGNTAMLSMFWTAALGLVTLEREDAGRWVLLGTAAGERVLGLQKGKHRDDGSIHLDLTCPPMLFVAEIQRLVEIGADLIGEPRREPYGYIANLSDPEGNLFDVCSYLTPHSPP